MTKCKSSDFFELVAECFDIPYSQARCGYYEFVSAIKQRLATDKKFGLYLICTMSLTETSRRGQPLSSPITGEHKIGRYRFRNRFRTLFKEDIKKTIAETEESEGDK